MPLPSPDSHARAPYEKRYGRLKNHRVAIGLVAVSSVFALHQYDALTPTAVDIGNTVFSENPDMRMHTLSECIVARLVSAHQQGDPQDAEVELAEQTIECLFTLGYAGTMSPARVDIAADSAYKTYIDLVSAND